ncbi:hypothetical protein QTV49_000564 [Vibrio vulnificus]|nr:hypothetical protein [Vibrio vulnificus]
MGNKEQGIDLSIHKKAELYKNTIREVKAHFLTVGYGESQVIKQDLLEKYFDLYPSKLEGVFLYSDGIVIQTDSLKFKISDSLVLSEFGIQDEDHHFLIVANAFLHQLSLMFPLYMSRMWVKDREKFGADRVFGALEEMNGRRFI